MSQDRPARPPLDPLYAAAESDCIISIRFIGNTPIIAELSFSGAPGVTPYHMIAAAWDLERRGKRLLETSEAIEMKRRAERSIAVPGNAPPLPPVPSAGRFASEG